MPDTKEAFIWITSILRNKNIPFQVTGGLAARIYGSPRELADIDFEIPNDRFPEILPEIKDYLVFGPTQYKDESFDIFLATLRYKEQEIDLTGSNGEKSFNQEKREWKEENIDLSKAVSKEVFGISVPVVPAKDLLDYKKWISRDVDRVDVEALSKLGY